MKIRMLDKKIAVEAANTLRKKDKGSLLTMPDTADCTGTVKYVSDDVGGVAVGDTVCYGKDRQRVKLDGADLEIMELDNIFAILDEEISK